MENVQWKRAPLKVGHIENPYESLDGHRAFVQEKGSPTINSTVRDPFNEVKV